MADEKYVLVYGTVQKVLGKLAVDNSQSKSRLALLRHNVSRNLGEDPELFGWLMENIPEELQGKYGNVSYAEQAIYVTLVMYPDGPMHTPDKISIAGAAKAAEIKREKLYMIETADTIANAKYSLRALLQLLKAKKQGIDYRVLACDLYAWQYNKVRMARKWERDYARKERKDEQ